MIQQYNNTIMQYSSQNLDDAASIKEGIIEKLTNAVSSTADGMMNVGGLFVDTLGSAGSTVFDGVVTGKAKSKSYI